MAGSAARGRSLWTVVGAIAVALLLWWFTADDSPAPATQESSAVDSAKSQTGELDSIGPADVVDDSGMATVRLADLPAEAADVVEQIDAGGPYDHPGKDGSTFGNYEGHLPPQNRGYYREYTVATPGLSHRGARRIVTGSDEEMYWTDDHYETFRRILR